VLAGFELTSTAALGEKQRQRDQESRRSYRVNARAIRSSAALLLSGQRGHPVGADCLAEDDRYRTQGAT